MADTHLLFERAPALDANLVFGEGVPVAATNIALQGTLPGLTARLSLIPGVDATLQATLPGLTASIRLAPRTDATLQGTLPALVAAIDLRIAVPVLLHASLPGLSFAAEASYHTNTQRPTVAQLHHTAQISQPTNTGLTQPEQHARPTNTGAAGVFTEAASNPTGVASGFDNALARPVPATAPFQDGTRARSDLTETTHDGDAQWLRFFSQFQEADRVYSRLFGAFADGIKTPSTGKVHKFQEGRPYRSTRYTGRAAPATPLPKYWQGEFQEAWPPPPGQYAPPLPPIPEPVYWGGDLVFMCPPISAPIFVFGATQCAPTTPAATLAILPARFYMAVHSLTAQHLPSLAPVPIFDVSLSADAGSFAWTFSASAPASVFDQLAPSAGLPAQIRITLDGLAFVFIVDSLQREEKFGQRGVKIAGRSATALLARPYAREAARMNIEARTAQQLAAEALDLSGAGLSWGLTDWLVPAGAWSHSGTPLAAVQAIVEAAGGYLQSHRSAATLLARHPYPTLPGGVPGGPWNWGGAFAPDVELAPDAIITAGIERRDGPDINAVYVSGTSQGVIALVKRIGTAGEKLAPMVTDPLITAPEAASQRGLSVLGAGGPKHLVSLSLPVLTGAGQPGVLDVGQLVQVNAAQPWRGRVRSVSVSAKLPSVRQTVALERHLEIV